MKKERIVVIGGGVLGICISWKLAAQGYHVTLLEKNEIASGASGGNLGQISLVDRHEHWHLPLALASLEFFRFLAKEQGLDYDESGGLTILADEDQARAGEKALKVLNGYGVPGAILKGKEINSVEKGFDHTSAYGVVYCPGEGKIDPFHLSFTLLAMAERSGALIHPHRPAQGFTFDHNGCITGVETNKGSFPCDYIVNAAGAWSLQVAEMAGFTIPLSYTRATAMVSRPLPPLIQNVAVGGGHFLAKGNRDGFVEENLHIDIGVNQNSFGSILLAQATHYLPTDERRVALKDLSLIAKKAACHYPFLDQVEILRSWSVITPYTADGLPVLGFHRDHHNLVTCAGFKGAFSVAPAVGDLVLALIQGKRGNPLFIPSRKEHATTIGQGENNHANKTTSHFRN